MKNDQFVTQKIKSILNESKFQEPLDKVMACIWLGAHYKGTELKILEVKEHSSLSDYFLLISVSNITQGLALADEILYQMKSAKQVLLSREGDKESDWILLDYGDFVVHIFLEAARSVYDLDSLWARAKSISIPQEYYMSDAVQDQGNDQLKDYF